MKNWKCKIGIHKYDSIGNQRVPCVVGGFSMVPLQREVLKCNRCGKIHFFVLDIAANAHNTENLNWQPKL